MNAKNRNDLARDLVKRLNVANTGAFDTVAYADDPFSRFDSPEGEAWTVISPMNADHMCAPRGGFSAFAELLMTMHFRQNVTQNEASLTAPLQSWDALIEAVKSDEPVKEVGIYRWHRFDPVKERVELICQAAISMKPQCEFAELEHTHVFEYGRQLYRKENDISAILLRLSHGEEVTERICYRFFPEAVVVPVPSASTG